MVKIRMTRMGRHKLPFYRIVAMDSRVRRDGAYIESFGTYDPVNDKVVINEEAVLKFLHNGAQPTDTARNILQKQGIWKKFHDQKLQNKLAKPKKEKVAKTSGKKPAAAKSSDVNKKAVQAKKAK